MMFGYKKIVASWRISGTGTEISKLYLRLVIDDVKINVVKDTKF